MTKTLLSICLPSCSWQFSFFHICIYNNNEKLTIWCSFVGKDYWYSSSLYLWTKRLKQVHRDFYHLILTGRIGWHMYGTRLCMVGMSAPRYMYDMALMPFECSFVPRPFARELPMIMAWPLRADGDDDGPRDEAAATQLILNWLSGQTCLSILCGTCWNRSTCMQFTLFSWPGFFLKQ